MKTLISNRSLLRSRWLKALVVANTTLVLTAVTSVAEAATINFRGSVTSVSSQRFPSIPGGDVDTHGEPLTTINTHKPVTAQDTIVGSYTFGKMDELLSARFRFVAPDSSASLDPSETDPLDIVFQPLPDIEADYDNESLPDTIKRTTTASGSDTSFSYAEKDRWFRSRFCSLLWHFALDIRGFYTVRFPTERAVRWNVNQLTSR